ncbi:MAG TPA: glycosyltransferase [Patescibacteria group bacterium]|nr:glycosyltransferase [Patescibacteria group bacterium]
MANVSVHIVARNAMGSLPGIVNAVAQQTYEDVTIRIADNASSDKITSFLRDEVPGARAIRNARDIGTASAQNQLIRMAMQAWKNSDLDDQFVLMLDTDVTMEPNAVSALVCKMQEDKTLGAVGGKILRMFDENIQDEALHERVQSDHIDSVGSVLSSGLDLISRGAGEIDTEQYDDDTAVFAVPGSMMLVRASALVKVRHSEEEYMDKYFGSGDEDKDLSWRLQHGGWGIGYVPGAVAYRYRGVFQRGAIHVLQNSELRRNRFLLLFKNLRFTRALSNFPRLLLLVVTSAGAFVGSLSYLPKIWKRRREILNNTSTGR